MAIKTPTTDPFAFPAGTGGQTKANQSVGSYIPPAAVPLAVPRPIATSSTPPAATGTGTPVNVIPQAALDARAQRAAVAAANTAAANASVPPANTTATPPAATAPRPVLNGVTQPDYAADLAGLKAPDENSIRQSALDRAQATIDATNSVYQQEYGRLQQEGTERLAQTRSINTGAGLAGSPFATTNVNKTEDATDKILKAREAERSAEIQRIRSDAEDKASNDYQNKITNYQNDREFYSKQAKDQLDTAKAKTVSTITNLAKGGYSLSELDPTDYQKLLTDSQMTDFEAKALYNQNTPSATGKTEIQGNQVVTYYVDPKTGKPTFATTPLPKEVADAQPADLAVLTTDSGVFVYDKANPKKDTDGNYVMQRVGNAKGTDSTTSDTVTTTDGIIRYTFDKDGNIVGQQTLGKSPSQDKPPTEAEKKSLNFYDRAKQATETLNGLETYISDLGIGGVARLKLPSFLQSNEGQQYTQARRQFTEAYLRKDSGAVIADSEIKNADLTYFPQPGDTPDQLAKKAAARDVILKGLKTEAGKAYTNSYGEDETSTATQPNQEDIDYLVGQGLTKEQAVQTLQSEKNKPLSMGIKGSAQKLASAIKQVESGGNYNAKGASGESGAYQFMPATWSSWAQTYLGNSKAPMTPENQDKVAQAHIESLLSQGYNPQQIALIWNGGEPKEKAGVNSKGVKYDSGAYAQKVLRQYSTMA